MMKLLTDALVYILNKLGVYSSICLWRSGHLKDVGWFNSFRLGTPVDAAGNPLPWMTYSSISFLEKRINPDMTVFEYSCGNSTLWWANRVKRMISCEHDIAWHSKMLGLIPSNVELYQINLEYGGAYCHKISEYTAMFDIIIVDGRDRNNCAKNCLNALRKNGVIIWDNSDRDSYKEGFIFLLQHGYKKLDFDGMGPINAYSWSTSIFYKPDNCLNI